MAYHFKVGQIVKVVNNRGMVASIGATAVVIKANHDFIGHDLVDVVWETRFNNQKNGGYESYHFKPSIEKGDQLLFEFMMP